MDKISGISQGTLISNHSKINRQDSNLFQNTLKAMLETDEIQKASARKADAASEIIAPSYVKIEDPSANALNETNTLLDLLETYSKEMENPEKSLKDIEPLIISIKNHATRLMKEFDETMHPDANLRKIAEQCALAANVEYIKFQRGDYI
ncbi:MAG TPA: hypothetical protein PKV75_01205 [Desulfobacterales bacterium]|nr:hypothetical protein [Desulfobacterales bacterium]